MTAFDDRKTAAEAKFTHDQEFQFKTIARRNKLLGLWAAEQMGISGEDAEAYAKQVVISDFEEPGDADVLRKVLGDLTDKGIPTTLSATSLVNSLGMVKVRNLLDEAIARSQEASDRILDPDMARKIDEYANSYLRR